MFPNCSCRASRGVAILFLFFVFPILVQAAPVLPEPAARTVPASSLETIVVTGSRTPQPLSAVLADVSVIDRDEITRIGVTGVADLLARLPGVEFVRNGGVGGSTSVYIRGAENRHTAVYIDGVRMDSQSTGGAVWEQVPLEQIERVEVLRGPAAAIYGSDAVAGVVQLFTRRGDGGARPHASLAYGSHDTVQGTLGVTGSLDALDYALSASHGRSDGFDATRPGAYAHNPDRDGWERSSAHGRVGYQISAVHRLEASLLASRMKSDYDGSPTADDRSRHSLRTANLAWQGRWNTDSITRLQLGETRSTYETQPDFYRTETTLRDYTLLHEQRVGVNVLTATLERREDKLFNPATAFGASFGGKRHQNAVGLGWIADLGAHGLQMHLRRDDDSEFGDKNTGSVAWGWSFLPQWRVSAALATSFRAPTLYQRFSDYGNPELVPETGRNVEIGLRWTGGDSEFSVSAWRNRVRHLINFGSAGPCISLFGCYQNIGRAELEGITVAGRTQLGGVALRASFDWHDPRNLDTDKVLQRRARRFASLGAETVLMDWTFGAELQTAGVRYENASNTQRMHGYGLLNLYASRPFGAGLVLEARIDNIGDRQYELARNYRTAGRTGQLALRWSL